MYQCYSKRDAIKNYFPMPNEIFNLGLCSGEISIYAYLSRCEDRKTYRCHPSYKTIGKAVHMSENTVRKYVLGLESKQLIRSEPSMITTKDGRHRNGSLIYTLRPIQEAINCWHERQMAELELAAAKQNAQKKLAAMDAKRTREEKEECA